MKTSELIKLLNGSLKRDGDLPVNIMSDGDDEPMEFAGISILHGEDGARIHLTLCGPETIQAFIG